MLSKLFPIFPSSVLFPTAVTLQIAKPLVTIVPRKTVFIVDDSLLSTAIDSPVNTDSFTAKSLDLIIIPSAGIKVPSSHCSKSPTTISSLAISIVSPLRITLLLG